MKVANEKTSINSRMISRTAESRAAPFDLIDSELNLLPDR
jgi:hypothetical protein